MKKRFSVKRRSHFNYILKNGKTYKGKNFNLFFLNNNTDHNRIGIGVNRNIENVPLKNRCRRLIREAYRSIELKDGYDIIFIWKTQNTDCKMQDVKKELEKAFSRLSLLKEK